MQIEVGTKVNLITSSEWKAEAWFEALTGGALIPGHFDVPRGSEEPDVSCTVCTTKKLDIFSQFVGCENDGMMAVADVLATYPSGDLCTTDRTGKGSLAVVDFASSIRTSYRRSLFVQNSLAARKSENDSVTGVTWRSALITLSPVFLQMLSSRSVVEDLVKEYPTFFKPRSLGAIHFPALVSVVHQLSQENENVWMSFRNVVGLWKSTKSGISDGMEEVMVAHLCGFPYIENKDIVGLIPVKNDKEI